jgi:hypothetical protein
MVTVRVGDKTINVTYDELINSGLIKDLLNQYGQDYVFSFPDKYHDVVDIYINYVRAEPPVITDIDDIRKCLDISTYLDDPKFFVYLMQQILNNWNNLKVAVYEQTNPDIQREMYLHCPYEFVPETYMGKPTFSREWLEINKNRDVEVNGDELYHTVVKYNEKNIVTYFIAYHTVNGKTKGHIFRRWAA